MRRDDGEFADEARQFCCGSAAFLRHVGALQLLLHALDRGERQRLLARGHVRERFARRAFRRSEIVRQAPAHLVEEIEVGLPDGDRCVGHGGNIILLRRPLPCLGRGRRFDQVVDLVFGLAVAWWFLGDGALRLTIGFDPAFIPAWSLRLDALCQCFGQFGSLINVIMLRMLLVLLLMISAQFLSLNCINRIGVSYSVA